ncbi:MAG: glycosyltransferase family 4 protein [Pseudomonadota bacterium]
MTTAFRIASSLTTETRPARALKLGVLTPHNPYDKRAFSGTVYHAVRALSDRSDLDLNILGPHQPVGLTSQLLRRRSPRFDPDILADDGSDFKGLDAIVGLVASPLLDRASQLTDLPLLHVTDATPGFLGELYGHDIPSENIEREARVVACCNPLYSSRVMAEQAVEEFGALAAHAQALPFGVNFTTLPNDLPVKSPLDRVELLFVGGNWKRKGGALMLAAFDRLRAKGVDAHLTLVGGVPSHLAGPLKRRSDVTLTGFLDKNRPRHLAKLQALFARAHLFVLPTRADCTPMVVAEALAHGTPVLATDVGGIAEMVGPGAGRTLPLTASPGTWATTIAEMTRDQMVYDMMADAATERTATHLNWDSWADGIVRTVMETALPRMARVA